MMHKFLIIYIYLYYIIKISASLYTNYLTKLLENLQFIQIKHLKCLSA
jgi:hypothetical protein